jgi:hypothetical protein
MNIVSFSFFVTVLGVDDYFESISEFSLKDNTRLVAFSFSITTPPNPSSHYLDIFPQSVASVLGPDRTSIEYLEGTLTRGRWKRAKWGEPIIELFPIGSTMTVKASGSDVSRIWTKTGWMFSSILSGAFESLDPNSPSMYWSTPMDLPNNIRIHSNPNEPLCTENVERFVDLVPCGNKRGIGKEIESFSTELARSEFFMITIKAAISTDGRFVLVGNLLSHFDASMNNRKFLIKSECPISRGVQPVFPKTPPPVVVNRSVIGTKNRPERVQGKLVISLTNTDSIKAHSVKYYDQLPFFLIPLWHTYRIETGMGPLRPSVVPTDGGRSPTYLGWDLVLEPNETVVISLDVYKRYIALEKFGLSSEKGFDVGSAVYRVDDDELFFTRGLVVVIPLPDATSTFNVLAIACTTMALFFGMNFRNFISKRSTLVGTDQASVDARDPPLIRLVKWLYRRIRNEY